MGSPLLSDEAIAPHMAAVPNWTREGDAIERELVFRNFREVVAFLVLISYDAEEADHHPDVTINYKRLGLRLSTHSEGGLTEKDFGLAEKIDRAFAARGTA